MQCKVVFNVYIFAMEENNEMRPPNPRRGNIQRIVKIE